MQLSPAAQLLHALLTDPDQHTGPLPSSDDLSDLELGFLLPFAYRSTSPGAGFLVQDAVGERQPRFTQETCAALFAALVHGLKKRRWAHLRLGSAALLRGGAPVPEVRRSARRLVDFFVRERENDEPFAQLAIAGLAGMDAAVEPELRRGRGPLAQAELDVLLGWEITDRAVFLEVGDESAYGAPPTLPGAWERLGGAPGYLEFARATLEAAAARVAALHAREIPFVAERAFDAAEKETIGRAVRLAQFRDEAWLPPLLDQLVRGVAVAPTPRARTLPSQAVLFEVGRAARDFPTPEAIDSLRTAKAITRHAGVPKQLDRMLKRIEQGLADRVEVAFRMPDHGFDADGRLRVRLGEHTALLEVGDGVALSWPELASGGQFRCNRSALAC